jgi:hypothetical protein
MSKPKKKRTRIQGTFTPDFQPQPKVVIFGAGVTGLTAAHELVERGWDVTVVEKEIDPLNVDECAIGGLAKTQWSAYQPSKGAKDGWRAEAYPLVPTVRLRVKGGAGEVVEDLVRSDPGKGTPLQAALKKLRLKSKEQFVAKLGETFREVLDEGSMIYLGRVATRLQAIQPFVPVLVINRGKSAPIAIASWLRLYLLGLGASAVKITPEADESLPQPVWQVETELSDHSPGGELPANPGHFASILPGEHGFRFFPALYRHVFDTLRRIPVRGEGQNFGDVYRTVYDNLVPTESNWLQVADNDLRPRSKAASEREVVRFPRRLRGSLREVFDALNDMQTELGYTARDVELLKLRLFKYMTSCRRRRNEQYEGMSWANFMGLSDLSPACRQDMERAPQLLAAMTAKESDARTQGNLATQLMLDPVNADERVDSTLNAPTTVAWFAPWKDYLLSQGVRFIPGALVGFKSDPKKGEIRPLVEADPPLDTESSKVYQAYYYVLALPVQAWSEDNQRLIREWKQAREGIKATNDHITRLGKWLRLHVHPDSSSADTLYKGLTGIQFYFDSDSLARSGHTLFMDSPWRLCAISQASFWNRRREAFDGYRGIVSVDIGSLVDGGTIKTSPRAKPEQVKSFWHTPRTEVPLIVWEQIAKGYGFFSVSALPYRTYRIDEYITYTTRTGTPSGNRAPFLINGIDEWDDRAGWDTPNKGKDPHEEPDSLPAEEPSKARYQLMPVNGVDEKGNKSLHPAWVLAGTFMQTWTRATTMESANESARHAVNTLLHHARGSRGRLGDLCRIWNPEEYEHADLRIWQELDEKLYGWEEKDPLPHMLDILDLDSVPDALLKTGKISEIVEDLVARVAKNGFGV